MNERDIVLKLQSYVDGQLAGSEAAALAARLRQDERQRALCDELRLIKVLVRDNQAEYAVPETRDFYWSQISRRIAAEPVEPARTTSSLVGWLRWLVPVGATALICAYWLLPGDSGSGSDAAFLVGHEMEAPLAETTSYSFRSESAGMTVVWVETRGVHPLVSGE
jgi:anti-sigma factor RsiW